MDEQYTDDKFTDYNPHNDKYSLKFSLPDDVWASTEHFIYFSDYFITIPPRYELPNFVKKLYHQI